MTRKDRLDEAPIPNVNIRTGDIQRSRKRISRSQDVDLSVPFVAESSDVLLRICNTATNANSAILQKILDGLNAREDVADDDRFELLVQIAGCFDCFGDFDAALEVAKAALQLAVRKLPLARQRQGHNGVAVYYFRLLDFELAVFHLSEGLRLAEQIADSVGKLALLSNAVVLLEAMGAIPQAIKLCSIIIHAYDRDGPHGRWLALQAAINAALISRRCTNDQDFSFFNNKACELFALPSLPIPDEWAALHEANQAYGLLKIGKESEAWSLVSRAVATRDASNTRSAPRLLCVMAVCCQRVNDLVGLRKCRGRLRQMIKDKRLAAVCREEILEVLAESYLQGDSHRSKRLGLAVMRSLREHLVLTKHGQYFRKIRAEYQTAKNGKELQWKRFPEYRFPELVCRDVLVWLNQEAPNSLVLTDGRFERLFSKIDLLESVYCKTPQRSVEYAQAENWALLAAGSMPGSHRRAWLVGRISALLATALGWDADASGKLELICRLHDIGTSVVRGNHADFDALSSGDRFRYQMEHTLGGFALLSAATDPLLQSAAVVASYHHEFWNGCGLPQGVRGGAIPIAARICAVANEFVGLLNEDGYGCWTIEEAAAQVTTLFGVQFDPDLHTPFQEMVRRLPKVPLRRFIPSTPFATV